MPPEFKFDDETTVYIPETVFAVRMENENQEHIVVEQPVSFERLKKIKKQLKHGQKGLVSARQVGNEIYSFAGIREVGFDPQATIIVSRGY